MGRPSLILFSETRESSAGAREEGEGPLAGEKPISRPLAGRIKPRLHADTNGLAQVPVTDDLGFFSTCVSFFWFSFAFFFVFSLFIFLFLFSCF
jgi:hypothetical protein